MKKLLQILILLISIKGYTQSSSTYINIPEDTLLSKTDITELELKSMSNTFGCYSDYKQQKSYWKKIGLKDLTKDTLNNIIRITGCNNVVEINKNGNVNIYITVYGKEGIIIHSYKKNDKNIYLHLLELNIDSLPHCCKLSGYIIGDDGWNYGFEIKTQNNYRYYNYWSPDVQAPSILEAKLADSAINYIYEICEIDKKYKEIISNLKPGTYSSCYSMIEIKKKSILKKLNN